MRRMPRTAASEAPVKRTRVGSGKSVAAARSRGRDTGSAARAALVSVDKPLTDMQKVFVKIWASGESILAASYRAGYADGGTFAYRMARMPNIIRLYDEEKRKYEAAADMTRKKVMDMLVESYEMAKLMAEPSSMVAAAREVGKMCGYYEPIKVQHQHTVDGKVVVDRMNSMTDEQLLEFISQQASRIQQPEPLPLLERVDGVESTGGGTV